MPVGLKTVLCKKRKGKEEEDNGIWFICEVRITEYFYLKIEKSYFINDMRLSA
jgi:hypothetical protein